MHIPLDKPTFELDIDGISLASVDSESDQHTLSWKQDSLMADWTKLSVVGLPRTGKYTLQFVLVSIHLVIQVYHEDYYFN